MDASLDDIALKISKDSAIHRNTYILYARKNNRNIKKATAIVDINLLGTRRYYTITSLITTKPSIYNLFVILAVINDSGVNGTTLEFKVDDETMHRLLAIVDVEVITLDNGKTEWLYINNFVLPEVERALKLHQIYTQQK